MKKRKQTTQKKVTISKKKLSSKEWDDRAKGGYANLEWVNSGDLLDEFIKFINPKAHHELTDLGTGTGKVAEELSRHAKHVYGVDYSQKMLDLAPKKENITYICADAKDIHLLPVKKLHGIVARMIFHHLNGSLEDVLAKAHNMLHREGSFFLCEGIPPSTRSYQNWKSTNILLENDRVFNAPNMWIDLFKKNNFKVAKTKTMAIKNLSTRKWLESRGESKEIIEAVIALRKHMSDKLKKDWNARLTKDDVFVDTYWFFLKADPAQPKSTK